MSETQETVPGLRVAKVHHPVTTLGPGRRVGLWLQGCRVGCRGCLSLDTWDPAAVPETPVMTLGERLEALFRADESLTGLTISGGEPSEQAAGLLALLRQLRETLCDRTPDVDILLYSGLTWRRLERDHHDLVSSVDAVIPEPFIAARAPGGVWRGSSNQPLVLVTDLAAKRYGSVDEFSAAGLQVVIEQGRMWTVGVPGPGDLDHALEAAAAHGVTVSEVSWRA